MLVTACSKKNQLPEKLPADNIVDAKTENDVTDPPPFFTIFPESGNTTYHSYRIPAIIRSKNGVLIALAEARKNSDDDWGDIDIVCRRLLKTSTDEVKPGITNAEWTSQTVIAGNNNVVLDDIPNVPSDAVAESYSNQGTFGNPTLVTDQTTGRVWLFMSFNDKDHCQSCNKVAGDGTYDQYSNVTKYGDRRLFLCYSDDDGATWSTPVDMTQELTPNTYKWDAVGPGIGIQKRFVSLENTLIIPANGRNLYKTPTGSWSYATVPSGTSESTIIERPDGKLLRNDRKAPAPDITDLANRYRQTSASTDLLNWTAPFQNNTKLMDPICQASILRYTDGSTTNKSRVMFMNSNHQTQRRHPAIRISYNEAIDWPIIRSIPNNGSGILGGYTSLVKTADNMTGALIEYNSTTSMNIQYHKISLGWILNGNPEP
ncbi:sialidase family protein [Mucilaginibacter sp. PAMB04168]|uniref:sialidase family protein n=1 Tax=Mucilaginibacter sp. PAMB04168 TaxID=3138567 RepID=UPI00331CA6CC